jgi:flavin-dependent dehydrogenase
MHDVIVIGGGPGGSTAATLLVRKGFSVLLLERERFPRFQIGESLLPYNNDLFDRLGVRDQLRAGDFFPKFGAAFCTATGDPGYIFRFDRNLASEQYHQAFQVKRADFDTLMLRNAEANGVDVREETGVVGIELTDPKRALVQTANSETHEARFVLDASGHGSVIGTKLGARREVPSLKKIAIFAHYHGVARAEGRDAGNTVIVVLRNAWFWLIPVNGETMSVGLVVDRDHVKECGLTPEELLARTIAETPWVAERMRAAERVTQVYTRKDFSFRMQKLVGANFALVGDAAGFLDPIFSTGVFMAMKSADLAVTGVEQRLRGGSMRALRAYERDMQRALGKYLRFIENFYRREFLEVFLQPPEDDLGLLKVITGVLAGNIFARSGDRMKLALFFTLVRLQKWRGNIAPRIEWESLPAAASL